MSTLETPLRYSMLIQWSDEDETFLVYLPEWHGRISNPVSHGDTYEEAVRNGLVAMENFAFVILEEGGQLPELQRHEITV